MAPIGHSMQPHRSNLFPPSNKVALALAVVKSKPLGVLMREYILQLRKHIQEGRRQESTHSLHRYVNSVAFWKDSYNEAIAAQAELKVRINELERVNDTLLSKLNLADRPGFELSNGKRRKKSADSRTGAVRRSSGQIKVWNHPSEVSVRVDIAELEVYGTSAENKLFMCQLYSYHRLLQDEAPDPRKLSSILLQLCSAAATTVSSACGALKSQIGPKIPSTTALQTLSPEVTVSSGREGPEIALGTMCRAHGRTFALLLQGFGKLNKTTESRGYQGQVIYSFVKLFGDILNGLQSVSVMQPQVQPRTETRTHTRKGQSEVFEEIEPGTLDKETDPRVHLCRLLVTMIASLEPAKPGHIDILEGFFYVLLERVGKTLYVFVFDEEESPILANRSHGDRLQYHGIGANLREALKRKAMQGEAKYLIWTLERAMTFVCRHHSVNPTAKVTKKKIKDASTSKAAVSKPPDKTNLSDRARTRLQNTLLKGIFGAGEKEFKDGLRMPAIAEMDLNAELPTVTEDETAEWFKQEVWRLLGWEILGQHDDI